MSEMLLLCCCIKATLNPVLFFTCTHTLTAHIYPECVQKTSYLSIQKGKAAAQRAERQGRSQPKCLRNNAPHSLSPDAHLFAVSAPRLSRGVALLFACVLFVVRLLIRSIEAAQKGSDTN